MSQLQEHEQNHDAAAEQETSPAAAAGGWWAGAMARPGLLLKRVVLAVGAVYFAMVAVTNLVNFIASVGHFHWVFLNSGNAAYIVSITKVYSWPVWADNGVVLAAALAEGFGAYLFIRALLRYRGGSIGMRAVWQALTWNIVVWLGFIIGTEFFVAYTSESPFRELLIIALAMPVIMAVVPDRTGAGA
jgi:hypothetical protein